MTNLKHIISTTPLNMIFLSSWLEKQNISAKSIYDHKKYGWLDSINRGAFIKNGIKPTLLAAISAIQYQTDYNLHIGGYYALDQYHNIRHFIRQNLKVKLFTSERQSLYKWFQNTFKSEYILSNTSFLSDDIGIQEIEIDGLKIKISTPERAFLEMLYSDKATTKESYQILEMMPVLKPDLLTNLLTQCKSVKVKRLFMYLASQTGYSWFYKIDKNKINLGSGVRVIDKDGKFNKEFKIIINQITEE